MTKTNRVYIVGAGHFGRAIAREIEENSVNTSVVAFLDDDRDKIGCIIDGIPVLGPIDACAGIIDRGHHTEAFIALPSASHKQLNSIYEALRKADFTRIRILPSVSQIVSADPHVLQAREMDPQDLLGREPVLIDLNESLSYVRGRRVLITGAGGSIGSELSRQLLHGGAERLYLFGHGENSIWEIQRELNRLQVAGVGRKAKIIPIIGELQDRNFIQSLLNRLKADIVFHGAAHKHVPMMEMNPVEAIKNNVFSTLNLADASIESGVKRFVLISTDKAVNPISMYGASKRIAEMIILSRKQKDRGFIVVRFGNVLGSRGSILPLFKEQIFSGGPISITHPDVKRWFMTIPEAVSLILKTAGMEVDGGLFLLDMGEPVRILDFALQMLRFYGYDEKSIPLVFTGMRPGEKMEEQLWYEGEHPHKTDQSRIIRVEYPSDSIQSINSILEEIHSIVFRNPETPELFRNRRKLRYIINKYFSTVELQPDEPEY